MVVGKISFVHRSRRGHVANTTINLLDRKPEMEHTKEGVPVLFIALDGFRGQITFTAGRQVSLCRLAPRPPGISSGIP